MHQLNRLIDLLVLNANISSISAISWREQIFQINLHFSQTLRNKPYLFINKFCYMYKLGKIERIKSYYLKLMLSIYILYKLCRLRHL